MESGFSMLPFAKNTDKMGWKIHRPGKTCGIADSNQNGFALQAGLNENKLF